MPMPRYSLPLSLIALLSVIGVSAAALAQPTSTVESITIRSTPSAGSFLIATNPGATHAGTAPIAAPLYIAPGDSPTLRIVAAAFAGDVHQVTGAAPKILASLSGAQNPIILGTIGHSPIIDRLIREGRLSAAAGIAGRWESAVVTIVHNPAPGVHTALVIAGSDRRGAAFALFSLSKAMGVSPWTWWADVPVQHRAAIYAPAGVYVQPSPSVRYRGIFLNDEDWGLRPWAAKTMDPRLHNIGPHTYVRIFQLLLRLHANLLWPAMHPGTLAFNAVPENAKLADEWGIVMSSSHSEALLRNNVGEWNEKTDGPWNYQTNSAAMDRYWKQRLKTNGRYENIYTVGLRGVHDTGLEATGTPEVKARLVEKVMDDQRQMLRQYVSPNLDNIPQVIWLYKESLGLYTVGMQVPKDVTLGWTDDNYGYIRQLPDASEQTRPGGSAMYYHVSYWGYPHDYLWLCSTPPALIREELTKAWDHGVRRMWILNVGDLKPAESDIDYFLRLAWNEPKTAAITQHVFLETWNAEQFPSRFAPRIAAMMDDYYRLNFIRKPEFMGFNGYDDGVNRTRFNPLAWGDQNRDRLAAWEKLSAQARSLGAELPPTFQNAYFELVGYPIQAAAAQNAKFLWTDRGYLDAFQHNASGVQSSFRQAAAAYKEIQALTAQYNSLDGGKWDGMMSAAPRERHVFELSAAATEAPIPVPLPTYWGAGNPSLISRHASSVTGTGTLFDEVDGAVSINAAHDTASHSSLGSRWTRLPELGISAGGSIVFGAPGRLASAPTPVSPASPWLQYTFSTRTAAPATLALHLLPTFPIDSQHKLRYAVSIDGDAPAEMDASGLGVWKETGAPIWAMDVLRNSAVQELPLGNLKPGRHTLRLYYIDPGIVFEHLVVTFAGSPPAYEVPPENAIRR
jgi:hypothetical protein